MSRLEEYGDLPEEKCEQLEKELLQLRQHATALEARLQGVEHEHSQLLTCASLLGSENERLQKVAARLADEVRSDIR